jgi:hypothetical protein
MTQEQFRRWYTFSIRMAHRGWVGLPGKSRKQVADYVKYFFRCMDSWGCPAGEVEDWDSEPYVCDTVDRMLEEHWNPHGWHPGNREYNRWDERWGTRVRCCLRAGLDLAAEPSAGVLGFEICDLRRMYRGRIPAWINTGYVDPAGKPVDLNTGECAVSIWL